MSNGRGHRVVTWAGAVLACLGMAACVTGAPGRGGAAQPILAGAMQLAAPAGYCIVPGSRLEQGDSALAIAGRCSTDATQPPAVMTATIGAAGSASGFESSGVADLAAWFRSPPGLEALSRRGRAADIRLDQVIGVGDALLLHLHDAGAEDGVEPASWRAVLPLRGRLVTLSAAGPADTPLPTAQGRALIEAFADRMRSANR